MSCINSHFTIQPLTTYLGTRTSTMSCYVFYCRTNMVPDQVYACNPPCTLQNGLPNIVKYMGGAISVTGSQAKIEIVSIE